MNTSAGALWAVMAAAPPAHAAPIVHQPVACVPVDRYARVAAEAPGASRVDLEFRTAASGPWYSARMTGGAGGWAGFLPRPTPAVRHLEYRIVATAPDAGTTATAPAIVRVAASPAECDAESRSSVDTPILVTVPEGAPLVPPVPAGLSPAGVVGPAPKARSRTGVKIAGAAAAVAIGAATAAGVAQSDEPDPEPFRVPGLRFNGTNPVPGTTISLGSGQLVVFVVMDHEPAFPVNLLWRVDLHRGAEVCARMDGRFVGAQRPVGLAFTAPLVRVGACGAGFDVSALRITVDYEGALVHDETVSVPFRFEP